MTVSQGTHARTGFLGSPSRFLQSVPFSHAFQLYPARDGFGLFRLELVFLFLYNYSTPCFLDQAKKGIYQQKTAVELERAAQQAPPPFLQMAGILRGSRLLTALVGGGAVAGVGYYLTRCADAGASPGIYAALC